MITIKKKKYYAPVLDGKTYLFAKGEKTYMPYKMVEMPYIELEYIKSTGQDAPYINTGIVADSQVNFTIDGEFIDNDASESWACIFGTRKDNNGSRTDALAIWVGRAGANNRLAINFANIDTGGIYNTYIVGRHIVSKVGSEFYLDGINVYSNLDAFSSEYDLYVFACNQNGEAITRNLSYKLYSLKIYNGNNTVRDFIPVLDAESVPCLYDKVTEQFFYNQGTGQFEYALKETN